MDKTIEKPFFDGYSRLVSDCIDWVDITYDLGLFAEGTPKKTLSPEWQERYEKEIPQKIAGQMEAHDCTVVTCGPTSPIIEEIEDNLHSTPTVEAKERYIFSLLRPFSELMGKIHPVTEIERLKQQAAADSQTGVERADSLEKIERVEYISRRYWEMATRFNIPTGTVEACLSTLYGVACQFANRLDALLLTHGIDLFRFERESGIYLKMYREITDVEYYIGSIELAQMYINRLPKTGGGVPKRDVLELPEELKTVVAREMMANAVEMGLLSNEGGRYVWKNTASLYGYFVDKVSSKFDMRTDNNRIPWKKFEFISNHKDLLETATSAVMRYKNNGLNPPQGDDIIDSLL